MIQKMLGSIFLIMIIVNHKLKLKFKFHAKTRRKTPSQKTVDQHRRVIANEKRGPEVSDCPH